MAQTPPGKDPELLCHGFYTPTVRVWLSTAHLALSSVSNARGLLGQVTAPCSQTSARQVGAARGNAWLQGRGWVPSLGAADKPCPAVQELLALPVASSHTPPGPASAELRTTLRKQTNPPKSGGCSSQHLGLPGEGSPALSSRVRAHQQGGGGNDSVFRLILFLAAAPMRSSHPLLPRRRCQRTVLSRPARSSAASAAQRKAAAEGVHSPSPAALWLKTNHGADVSRLPPSCCREPVHRYLQLLCSLPNTILFYFQVPDPQLLSGKEEIHAEKHVNAPGNRFLGRCK